MHFLGFGDAGLNHLRRSEFTSFAKLGNVSTFTQSSSYFKHSVFFLLSSNSIGILDHTVTRKSMSSTHLISIPVPLASH